MVKAYPAIIHEEDGYWVEFPDLPGCQTCGSTLENTLELASEALGLYLADIQETGKPFPEPTPIQDINSEGCLINYITADPYKYRKNTKAVKKTLSIPAWLAEEAEKHNLSLSKVLQDGLKHQLGL